MRNIVPRQFHSRAARLIGLLILVMLIGPGCARLGPRTIRGDSFNYNESIARSMEQQILLNLVRHRYGDTEQFVQVASVLSQYTLTAGASMENLDNNVTVLSNPFYRTISSLRADQDFPGQADTRMVHLEWTDRPTITYSPLQGKEYAEQVMTPIHLHTFVLLNSTQESTAIVMRMIVDRLNYLANPDYFVSSETSRESTPKFHSVLQLAQTVFESNFAELGVEDSGGQTLTYLFRDPSREPPKEWAEFCDLLGLDPEATKISITNRPFPSNDHELAIQTRSLSTILGVLSLGFEPPEQHVKAGIVIGPPHNPELPGGAALIDVQSSLTPPLEAFVTVRHRGYWFYIADDDIESKRAFGLLRTIFSLQSGGWEKSLPVVTVPSG